MFLLVAATEQEMAPVRGLAPKAGFDFLVSGVGPVEAAFQLTRYLSTVSIPVSGVINFGVAGAYFGSGLDILDLCLADREVFADFGICLSGDIIPLDLTSIPVFREFSLDNPLARQIVSFYGDNGVDFLKGTFATVSGVSGTEVRGRMLSRQCQAICENMEGAAMARVCQGLGIDFVEVRAISNMVEDRNTANWRLGEAAERVGAAIIPLVNHLQA